jgi:catechol 2,3-dioxygenase-like lactoylglutathione lyase family enzyme
VEPLTLDHVAFWVADRDVIAERCQRYFGMHVIDRQQSFTLLGRSARHGKLTLFDAPGPRERGLFRHLGLRVRDLAAARALLPPGSPELVDLGEGLAIRLVEGPGEVDYDLDHVALGSPDPLAAAAAYERFGFPRNAEGVPEVAGARIILSPAEMSAVERPLLNHLAVLVASAEEHKHEALRRGLELESEVDAANTRAVFLWGPDRVRIEYVEHKSTFSLV